MNEKIEKHNNNNIKKKTQINKKTGKKHIKKARKKEKTKTNRFFLKITTNHEISMWKNI